MAKNIILLQKIKIKSNHSVVIGGSKSETNRLLLLQALYPSLELENISESDDSQVMQIALQSDYYSIDIGHAGTAMRFLTAYFASQQGKEVILTGSKRMKQRPIKILVEALQSLGADIEYLENDGCPPLKINGKKIEKSEITIDASVSSQYISALLLIAPSLPNGLKIKLQGECTSLPYLKMTTQILEDLGVELNFSNDEVQVFPCKNISKKQFMIESDWSSASYYFSLIALSEIGTTIHIQSFKVNSLQGDKILIELYQNFGVSTHFEGNNLILEKTHQPEIKHFSVDCTAFPDLAQTLMVTCLGLQITAKFTGLHTLKIKETDRIEAMATELRKFGLEVATTTNSLEILNTVSFTDNQQTIDTYHDHRMALAFAPLCLKTPIQINDAEVVSKSYPDFWKDLERILFVE